MGVFVVNILRWGIERFEYVFGGNIKDDWVVVAIVWKFHMKINILLINWELNMLVLGVVVGRCGAQRGAGCIWYSAMKWQVDMVRSYFHTCAQMSACVRLDDMIYKLRNEWNCAVRQKCDIFKGMHCPLMHSQWLLRTFDIEIILDTHVRMTIATCQYCIGQFSPPNYEDVMIDAKVPRNMRDWSMRDLNIYEM